MTGRVRLAGCLHMHPDIESPAERRRTVMKVYITLYGGISLYAAGVLDPPSEKALIAELSAMNAGK